jgi:hypothetical protein
VLVSKRERADHDDGSVTRVDREVERFDLPGSEVTLFGASADSAFSVQEWRAPARAGGIPIHLHRRTVEASYVVAGELGRWLDDRPVVRPSGSSCQRGRRHSF